jgi:hypothetical protein
MINCITQTAMPAINVNLVTAINTLMLSEHLAEKDTFFVVFVRDQKVAIASDTDGHGNLVEPNWTINHPDLPIERNKFYIQKNETGKFTLMLPEDY